MKTLFNSSYDLEEKVPNLPQSKNINLIDNS